MAYLFIQFSGCDLKRHHPAVGSFLGVYLHETVMSKNSGRNEAQGVELTVMLPFPAGLFLSFITSGLVSVLEETIYTKT